MHLYKVPCTDFRFVSSATNSQKSIAKHSRIASSTLFDLSQRATGSVMTEGPHTSNLEVVSCILRPKAFCPI
jgi:hypothetical protein